MNLFDLFVRIGVKDEASDYISGLAGKLGSGISAAASVATAAVGVAVSGIAALTAGAIKNYAEYEQLVGGVDTLFKESSQRVQEYAANAFETAGVSANTYMETVTSFSASLLRPLAVRCCISYTIGLIAPGGSHHFRESTNPRGSI